VNVISKNSGKCLDMKGGPSATWELDPAQQWTCLGGTNQSFKFTIVTGGYEITAQSSDLQLDVRGGPSELQNGARIIQYPYWGAANEIWNLVPTSDGYVNIVAKSSGSCMDVRGISKADGAAVQQWACWGGDNQKWKLVPVQ
jgi:glucosylceramidase